MMNPPDYRRTSFLVVSDKVASFKNVPAILLEAISKKGFWFKFKADPSFNPQVYWSIPRS
jgi:hypothetical protein